MPDHISHKSKRDVEDGGEASGWCAAPPALESFCVRYPALSGRANLCRASGAWSGRRGQDRREVPRRRKGRASFGMTTKTETKAKPLNALEADPSLGFGMTTRTEATATANRPAKAGRYRRKYFLADDALAGSFAVGGKAAT